MSCPLLKEVSSESWKTVLSLYDKALAAKAIKMKPEKKTELFKLDQWQVSQSPIFTYIRYLLCMLVKKKRMQWNKCL